MQPLASPFRLAACSYENDFERSMGDADIETGDEGRLAWSSFVVKSKDWGYATPPPIYAPAATAEQQNRSLITLGIATSPDRKVVDLKCDTVAFQWNPSTIIALQRFAGRLRKEATGKIQAESAVGSLKRSTKSQEALNSAPAAADAGEEGEADQGRLDVTLNLRGLSVCLNKEHEGRRLLRLSLSDVGVAMRSDLSGKSVDARIGGFAAMDQSKDVHELNRVVIGRGEGAVGEMVEVRVRL